ncbi:MAG TPA: PH domain-containing protein [Thermoanaerobaculia bacterium]|nr:PH domain-containing protein [Thermoanaerobaculia bacterium]
MRFESKRDLWLLALALGGPAVVLAIVPGPVVVKAIAIIILLLFGVWTFGSTYYVIDGGTLTIRSMGLRWRVPIRDIRSITPTRSVASSPALSLDRLRIDYGTKAILVSPEDRNRFIAALRSVNPSISV